ncbi:MAG: hypothetical protein M5U28_12755 [Sandaracinaceae bacterium]|nr:hypothetical protein [Sandaracinaceae bacterium]
MRRSPVGERAELARAIGRRGGAPARGGRGRHGRLRRPERSIEELEAARRDARGNDRRAAVRDLVVAHMFAAEEADEREARRLRRRAEQLADAAVRGSRDAGLIAEIDFARLWMSWRSGAANAEPRATRFTERHRSARELVPLAWMIRGELALVGERFDDAVAAFRFALGDLEHPLYAYALWRTAASYRRLGRADDATQALAEVEQLGCASGASAFVVRVATAAASERGSGLRQDTDGVTRPASCAAPESGESESTGWRPAE